MSPIFDVKKEKKFKKRKFHLVCLNAKRDQINEPEFNPYFLPLHLLHILINIKQASEENKGQKNLHLIHLELTRQLKVSENLKYGQGCIHGLNSDQDTGIETTVR